MCGILTHSPPTLLSDTHLGLPFYYILRKIPAYPFIKFDKKVQPTRIL